MNCFSHVKRTELLKCRAPAVLLFMFLCGLIVASPLRAADSNRWLNTLNVVTAPDNKLQIQVEFTEPVKLVSHKINSGRDVLLISLGVASAVYSMDNTLAQTEKISWKATDDAPLLNATLDPANGSARLYLYFSKPVNVHKVSGGSDARKLLITLMQPGGSESDPSDVKDGSSLRLEKAMANAKKAMTTRAYSTAIQIYTAILEEPDNGLSKDALELLGLARERNGQNAHANAEYEKYLALYPTGDGSRRVRQRQAGLLTATMAPKEKLRMGNRMTKDSLWDLYGSLASYYERNQSSGDGLATKVSRSDLVNSVDFSATRINQNSETEFRLTADHSTDLLKDVVGNESKIAYAYLDHQMENGFSTRIGRQRHSPSGASYRFDGAIFSYKQSRGRKYNFVYGAPIERSRDSYIHKEKRFYGLSAEFSNVFDKWDYSFYFINQDSDGIADRQALGGEVRYFDNTKSIFTLLDYDILFDKFNSGLVVGNYNLDDGSTAYINLDYRNSPQLRTSNALIGQNKTSLDEFNQLFTMDEIHQFAKDRTARSQSVTLGGTKPIRKGLRLGADISVFSISGTESSGGVEATPKSGNDFYYSAHLIKEGFFTLSDIGIVTLQYTDGSTADTIALTLNSRFLIDKNLRVNSRLRFSHRDSKQISASRYTLEPKVDFEYRMTSVFQLEAGLGAALRQESSNNDDSSNQDYLFNLGARWSY